MQILNGHSLPNIPWEDRPDSCRDPIWRYSGNPIIPRNAIPCAALVDADSGRMAIYYGCADTVTGLAFAEIDVIVDFVLAH